MRKQRRVVNPLAMLAGRQKLPREVADEYALPAWIYLDAVFTGRGDIGAVHGMTKILVMVQIIASDRGNRPVYDMTAKAIKAWLAAVELAQERGTTVDPSTSLRKLLALCVSTWDNLLPQIDLGLLVGALERWQELAGAFGITDEVAA